MSTEEKIAIMQAFVNGQTVQCKSVYAPTSKWDIIDKPAWDWSSFIYRVKPREYREFEDYNEFMWHSVHHHSLLKHTQKSYTSISYPTEIRDGGIIIQDHSYPWDLLLKCFVWADDGTPCGVKND